MKNEDYYCPINGDYHKYFIFKTLELFEIAPLPVSEKYGQLYTKQEYALLGCNCGSVIKSKIKVHTK